MADYSTVEMVQELITDLQAELEPTDDQFDAVLLKTKVVGAYRDIKDTRRYPSYYTSEEIERDMENFYMTVRSLALYDYNTVGIEWQKVNKENDVSREFILRSSLFSGVIPLSHI